jgi:large subunit ribosomal protein L24
MSQKTKIKKGDNVIVITGKDKGKTGEVFIIQRETNKVKVRGINIVKKHKKPTQNSPGGIEQIEAFINLSNISNVDPKDKKATKVKYKILDGKKIRISSRTGEEVIN